MSPVLLVVSLVHHHGVQAVALLLHGQRVSKHLIVYKKNGHRAGIVFKGIDK